MDQQPLDKLTSVRKLTTVSRRARQGLAPLEFVMWLPVLMFVTALIVNYGTMAAWRVRGEVVARDAAWRARPPRNSGGEPRPGSWPGTMSRGAAPRMNVLEHPLANQQVVRGPLPNNIGVRQVLDPTPGPTQGEASITRQYPLLPRLGQYDSGNIRHPLLVGKWQGFSMGVGINLSGRMQHLFGQTEYLVNDRPLLYELPRPDMQLVGNFLRAKHELTHLPYYTPSQGINAEAILDVMGYDWRRYLPFHRRSGYNFRPRVPLRCTTDRALVQRLVDLLIDNVQGDTRERQDIINLPRRITSGYISMFQATIREMERLIQWMQDQINGTPRPPANIVQQYQQLISEYRNEIENVIKPKIEILQNFLQALPPST